MWKSGWLVWSFLFAGSVCFAGVLEDSGVKGGVVVCVGADAAQQVSTDWKQDRYLFQCLETSDDKVSNVRKLIQQAGCYGKVSAVKFDGKTLPYQDTLVNLLVIGAGFKISESEINRVLTPNGVAMVAGKKRSKPWPKELDEWTHYLYGPDNNAVTKDKQIFSPRGIQWVSGPRWGRSHEEMASMSSAVSADGRVFFIADEAPPASIRFASDWKLTARDAFNGTLLWKKDIPQWIDHLRHFRSGPAHLSRRLVAIGNTVFVTPGLAAPVTAIDGATGEILKVYAGTEHTEEILYENGILYLVVGTSEAERIGGGLHLRGEPEPTGFRYMAAVDAKSGKRLWKNDFPANENLLPLSLTVRNGSVFYQTAIGVGRLDVKSGKKIWQTPRATMAKRMGFSAPTLVATDGVLLCADRTPNKGKDTEDSDGKVSWAVHGWNEEGYSRKGNSTLIAYAEADGKALWSVDCTEDYNAPVDLFVVGDSVWVGSEFKKYDLKTGALQTELDWKHTKVSMPHHRCYRDKASETHIFTGRSGIEVVSMETGLEGNNSWIRGTCQYGIMPANGLLYAPPDACACNSKTKVQGFFAASTARLGITEGMPAPAPNALEKGPAYSQVSDLKFQVSASDWPMYRADNMRSGSAKTKVPAAVKAAWSVKLGGKLTQPVSVGGTVYVASVDQHTVYALSGAGEILWQYTAGGRIDSSPTIYNGTVLFGSADGWVYCLRATDGALAWRFRAAPRERFVGVFDQLECVWPVHGSVLVQNGTLYVTAGRSSYLDGGLVSYRLDPAKGKVISSNVIYLIDPATGAQTGDEKGSGFDMEGIRSTLLSGDGESIFMKHWQFDADGKKVETTKTHLLSASGLLDDEWFVRSFWLLGTDVGTGWGGWADAAAPAPSGRILSFDDGRAYGYGRVTVASAAVGHTADAYHLFCADRRAKPTGESAATGKQAKNKKSGAKAAPPIWADENSLAVRAMALTSDKLVVAGTPDVGRKDADVLAFVNEPEARDAFNGGKGAFLRIVSIADGSMLSEVKLGAMPVFDGLSAANGKILISLQDGSLVCFGK